MTKQISDLTKDELKDFKKDLFYGVEEFLKENSIEVLTSPDYKRFDILWASIDAREMAELTVRCFINKEEIMNEQEFVHPTEEEIEEMQRAFDRDYGDLS